MPGLDLRTAAFLYRNAKAPFPLPEANNSPASVVIASAADLQYFAGQQTYASAQQVMPLEVAYNDDGTDKFIRFSAQGYPSIADSSAYVRWRRESADGTYRWLVRIVGAATAANNHYGTEPYARAQSYPDGLTLYSGGPYRATGSLRQRIRKILDGVITDLAASSVSPAAPLNTWYWHEFRVWGNQISARYYLPGNSPGAWITVTDSAIVAEAGQLCGLGARLRTNQQCDIKEVHFTPS